MNAMKNTLAVATTYPTSEQSERRTNMNTSAVEAPVVTPSEKVWALVKEVKEGVAKIQSSDDWKKFLDASAKFWRYSFNNQMLIAIQRSNATQVAGFHTWKEMGRYVKAGEHGIRILAPMLVKVKDGQEDETIVRFRSVSVFDISQTEGKDLPSVVHPLKGEAPGGMFFKLKEFAETQGFTVQFGSMTNGRQGYLNDKNEIVLKSGVGNAQSSKTLCHELAHGMLKHLDDKELSASEKELEAETSAWVVCRNLGLETSEYSFGYLATWAPSKDRDAKLEKAAHKACEVAKKIMEGLEKAAVGVKV
jgi:antirestriction protein ArdC